MNSPVNTKHIFQPLDLTVNRIIKSFRKRSLVINTVQKPLYELHNTKMKLKSSVLKSLYAESMVKLHNT